jgi:CBS domain-containing protein
MLISDVLRDKGREVITVRTSDKVSAAVAKLAEKRIGAVIVEDRYYKPVGIFSERDLVKALARSGPRVLDYEVRELMTSPFMSCRGEDRVDAVLGVMTMQRIRHFPVMENGELVGLVSIGDLVKHRLDEKELEANVLLEITRMRA